MLIRPRVAWKEKVQRYRGIALLILIPALIIGLIVYVAPRGRRGALEHPAADAISELAEAKAPTIAGDEGSLEFCIVFDAGSTGSRIHVYKFKQAGGRLDLESDTFNQLKPGLSSYADDPESAAQSLQPLLEVALQTVPAALQARTRVKLGATAGLRLLKEGKAEGILAAVTKYLQATPFQLDPKDGITILDGAEEGAFAWLTLNYLLGHLGKPEDATIAAIDLGGGSVQQAYALTAAEAAVAPVGYVSELAGGGRRYHVYVHSYLGFGLMAGRAAVLAWEDTRAANPCVPRDHSGVYEYGGAALPLAPHPDGPSFEACSRLVALVLHEDQDCGAPKDQCAFSGAWGGARHPTAFYVSSYFWDRATDAGIIGEEGAITWALRPSDMKQAGERACATPLAQLTTAFPKVDIAQAPFLCLDLSFQHTLLTRGFKIPETAQVTLVKKVKYQTQEIEAAWPLGAAINLLSAQVA